MSNVPRLVPLYTHTLSTFRSGDPVVFNPQFEVMKDNNGITYNTKGCILHVKTVNRMEEHGFMDIYCKTHINGNVCPVNKSGFVRIFNTDLIEGREQSLIGSLVIGLYLDECHACNDSEFGYVIRTTDGHNICRKCVQSDKFYPPYKKRVYDSDCCRISGCGKSKNLIYTVSANEILETILGGVNAV